MGTFNETDFPDFEADEDAIELSQARLIEGVRDTLLVWFKQSTFRKPWDKMTEADQRNWGNRIEERAEKLVRAVVDLTSSGGYPVVHAKIDNFQIKNGEVKITAKGFADNEVLITLNSAQNTAVKLIVADMDQFDQGRSNLPVDPDEPGLPGVKMDPRADEPGFEDEDDEPEVTNPEGEQEEGEAALEPKSDAWRGGYNSRVGGFARDQNPFNVGSQEFKDWFDGWDSLPESDPAGESEAETEAAPAVPTDPSKMSTAFKAGARDENDGKGRDQNPYSRNPSKADWLAGWDASRADRPAEEGETIADNEPKDLEPEGELPATVVADDSDDITNQDGEIIETEQQAYDYGAWCRSDGRGTGSNPFPLMSPLGKAFLRGYGDAKRKATEDVSGF